MFPLGTNRHKCCETTNCEIKPFSLKDSRRLAKYSNDILKQLSLQSNTKMSICLYVEHYSIKFLHGFGMISPSKLIVPHLESLTVHRL